VSLNWIAGHLDLKNFPVVSDKGKLDEELLTLLAG